MKQGVIALMVAASLMACAPATVGTASFSPYIVTEGSSVDVPAGKTSYIQLNTSAFLIGLPFNIADQLIPQFTYDDIQEGKIRQVYLDKSKFRIDTSSVDAAWNLSLDAVRIVRYVSDITQNTSTFVSIRRYIVRDRVEVLVTVNPASNLSKKLDSIKFGLQYSEGQKGILALSLNLR